MSVEFEVRDAVGLITINRPEARNAIDPETGAGIASALRTVRNDASLRAAILTGAGDRSFSAGMDLRAFASGADMSPFGEALQMLDECEKPVIAAINGAAVAGGFEIALRCDLIVAVREATFGLPEVKRGLVAAGGGTRLPRRIPIAVALEMGLTGDPISAEEAQRLGLVNRVVESDELLPAAFELAARIAANGPLAVQATKRLMLAEIGPIDMGAIMAIAGPVMASEDAREGATAFAERRPPSWKAR
jgi:enoyl-CoA hydratase/crotonobetainyl-CoA hydratase